VNTTPTAKTFAAWYESLGPRERAAFARRSKTTQRYIETHLLAPHKIPRAQSMKRLAIASGVFTVGELAAWFYEASLARQDRGRRT
jgi:hypothetical protein